MGFLSTWQWREGVKPRLELRKLAGRPVAAARHRSRDSRPVRPKEANSLFDLAAGVPLLVWPMFGGIPATVLGVRRIPCDPALSDRLGTWPQNVDDTHLLGVELTLIGLGRATVFPHGERFRLPVVRAPQHWRALSERAVSKQVVRLWLDLIGEGLDVDESLQFAQLVT